MSEPADYVTPARVQRKRTAGYRMPPNTVSVTRPGRYANPYRVGIHGTAEECVAAFRKAWERALRLSKVHPLSPPSPFGKPVYLGPLRGKNLACFCSVDEPFCHADVLLKLANR
jgi:uncharacterized protein DUF4326